jgi:hypothetical protein
MEGDTNFSWSYLLIGGFTDSKVSNFDFLYGIGYFADYNDNLLRKFMVIFYSIYYWFD